MRFIISIVLLIVGTLFSSNDAFSRSTRTSDSDVYVNWYYRSNWTYVQPHYRSAPDWIVSNNYWCIDSGICGWSTYSTTNYYDMYNYSAKQISCNRKYPWTIYQPINDMCICSNWWYYDNKYWKCITKEEKNEIKNSYCALHFPGAFYHEVLNECICANGWLYDKNYGACLTTSQKNQLKTESCSSRFPWTSYDEKIDMCACPNWDEFDSIFKYCPKIKTCFYSDWTEAQIWDLANDNLKCQSNWEWGCIRGYVWNHSVWKCIILWDNACKREFWINSVYSGRKDEWKYVCKCTNDLVFIDWICAKSN